MEDAKLEQKKQQRKERKDIRRKKKNALIFCKDGREYWTTQNQFWQWVRERVIVKEGDYPLTGRFIRANEETAVIISNTVLNLAHPNHLREALYSRRFRTSNR